MNPVGRIRSVQSNLRRSWQRSCAVALLLACSALNVRGEDAPLEYQVKAAFLLNFLKFTEWPANAKVHEPYTIGVLGPDPFGEVLDETLKGKTINGRPVRAVRCNDEESAARCHVVFIGKDDRRELKAALEKLAPHHVLLVGEGGNFLREGGVIRFVIDDQRVRFEIDLNHAERANLKLSAKLLQLARKVFKKGDAQ